MSNVDPATPFEPNDMESPTPIPAARSLTEFSMERVGDDVVLFDCALNRYHTLNLVAFDIWRQCDGHRSIAMIGHSVEARRCRGRRRAARRGRIVAAPEASFESTMHRRKLVKLVAARTLWSGWYPSRGLDQPGRSGGLCYRGLSCRALQQPRR